MNTVQGMLPQIKEKSNTQPQVLKLLLSISPGGHISTNCTRLYCLPAWSKPQHTTRRQSRSLQSLDSCSGAPRASSSPEMPMKLQPHTATWAPADGPPELSLPTAPSGSCSSTGPEPSSWGHDGQGSEQYRCGMFRCPHCQGVPITAGGVHR